MKSFTSRFKTPFFRVTSFIMGAVFAAGLVTMFAVKALDELNVFELDGNASRDTAANALPDDWQDIWLDTDVAVAKVFIDIQEEGDGSTVVGGVTVDADVTYPGINTKDVIDIDGWTITDGDIAPRKDEILNAFAAAYLAPATICTDPATGDVIGCGVGGAVKVADAGDLLVSFGMDRLATNGDAQVGFWFIDSSIVRAADGTPTGFAGPHTTNDVLVLSNFVKGGKVPDIRVYRWVGSGGSDNELDLLAAGADCTDKPHANPHACAVVIQDDDPTEPPWDYYHLPSRDDFYHAGSFYEGMVNLTQLGITEGCISSFLAETRSSQSVNAELKDFAFGDFDLCEITVTKDGDALSKVGDDVTYDFTIQNTGALPLYRQDVSDTVLGPLNSEADAAGCGLLSASASCAFSVDYTVMVGDPDPLENIVTVDYNPAADGSGEAQIDSAAHSVNLFQPSITLAKTGDDLSKVGDSVDYTITLNNTSSADTPDLLCTVTDALLGVDDMVTLSSGGSHVINASRTVMAGDPDPLVNTANASCTVQEGFGNVLTASASHSVNLFQPSITLAKAGDDLSKVGDSVDYTITLNNTSSADTPDLLCTVTDALLGVGEMVTLSSGGSHVINASRTVLSGDSDPLVNTADVSCTVQQGFGNVLTASASHSVNLFQPSVMVTKDCREETFQNDIITAGERGEWVFTVTNNSSADSPNLVLDSAVDSFFGPVAGFSASLAPGASETVVVDYTPTLADVGVITNTIVMHYHPSGFPNDITDDFTHNCPIAAPGPATIVWEKVSIGGVGTYNYNTTNDPDGGGLPPLVPLTTVVSTGINPDADSPFTTTPNDGVSGFASTVPNFSVTTKFGEDLTYTITEDLTTVPFGSTFTSVECREEQSDGSFLQIIFSTTNPMVSLDVGEDDVIYCRYVNTFPAEGCTPGYWRNHLEQWPATGFAPTDDFDTVFGVDYFSPDITLGEAINLGGGGVNRLARHGTAALLSAAHPQVNYPFSVAQVIALVQAGDADPLAEANERECPIN